MCVRLQLLKNLKKKRKEKKRKRTKISREKTVLSLYLTNYLLKCFFYLSKRIKRTCFCFFFFPFHFILTNEQKDDNLHKSGHLAVYISNVEAKRSVQCS